MIYIYIYLIQIIFKKLCHSPRYLYRPASDLTCPGPRHPARDRPRPPRPLKAIWLMAWKTRVSHVMINCDMLHFEKNALRTKQYWQDASYPRRSFFTYVTCFAVKTYRSKSIISARYLIGKLHDTYLFADSGKASCNWISLLSFQNYVHRQCLYQSAISLQVHMYPSHGRLFFLLFHPTKNYS